MTDGEKMIYAAAYVAALATDPRTGISRVTTREAAKIATTTVNEYRFGADEDELWRDMTQERAP